jgi:DNA polymerase delta subunit 1
MFVEIETDECKSFQLNGARGPGRPSIQSQFQAKEMFSLSIHQLRKIDSPVNFPIRVVAFDFETTGFCPVNNCIFQVSLVFRTLHSDAPDTKRFLLNVRDCDAIEGVEVHSLSDERGLLKKMMNLLVFNEWDVVTGYNIFMFDFPMLQGRLKKYGLVADLRRWSRTTSTNFAMGKMKEKKTAKGGCMMYPQVMGRFSIDLQPYIEKHFSKLRHFNLAFVSTHFIGKTKIDLPFDCNHSKPCTNCKTQKTLYADGSSAALAEIGEYCVVDSELCLDLLTKLNVLGNQIEFANVVYFPLDHIFTSGEMQKISAQIFVHGFQSGFVFVDKPYDSNSNLTMVKDKKYKGALVLDPLVGAYMHNIVAVLDFASL